MKTKCGDVCVHCTVMATVCIFCIICFYTLCVHDFWTFWPHNLIFQYETQPSFRYFFSLWEFMSGLLPQVEGGQSFTNKSQYSLKHTSLRRSGRGGQSCRRDTPQLFQKHTPHWVPDVLPWWDCNALRIAGPYLLRGHGSVWEKLPQSSTEKQVIWWEWSCLTGKPVECVFVPSSGVARLSVVELVGEGQLTRSLMRTGFMRELHEELIWLNYRCSFDFTSLVTINIKNDTAIRANTWQQMIL